MINPVRLTLPLQLRIRTAFTNGSILSFPAHLEIQFPALKNETVFQGRREKVMNNQSPGTINAGLDGLAER